MGISAQSYPSPGGAKEGWRWANGPSYAPPGLARTAGDWTHGSRHGLLSSAPTGREGKTAVRWSLSRVAASESSPWRKPWVSRPQDYFPAPEGRKRAGCGQPGNRAVLRHAGAGVVCGRTHGSRHGLLSYAATRLVGSAITKISVNDFFKPIQPSATQCKSKRQLVSTKPPIGGIYRGT